MRVLIVGSGGREHALAWKIHQSPLVKEIYCAPGNPGMSLLGDCIPIDPSNIVELADFAQKLSVELTVVGPELPLVLGISDEFEKRGLPVFGPSRAAAELEGSKAFAKEFMRRHRVPTSDFKIVSELEEARSIIAGGELGLPLVVKADGLAAGKGVTIARNGEEAETAVEQLLRNRSATSAASKVVLEQFVPGNEVSFFALSDGSRVLPLMAARDYKAAFDGDRGPNTGGMGCICPATTMKAGTIRSILDKVVRPTISGLAAEGRRYKGLLYAGLMITNEGPYVLEYNARFGDPETQSLLPRLKGDLVPLLAESAAGSLGQHRLEWSPEPAVTVVLASGGYPASYQVGKLIEGVSATQAVEMQEKVFVFQAGTKKTDEKLFTAGGRVLAVTSKGQSLKAAVERVYEAAARIHFPGVHYRKDIGSEALAKLNGRP